MKHLLFAALGLGGLIVVAAGGLYGLAYTHTESLLAAEWQLPTPQISLSTDPQVLEHGRHLTQHVLLCEGCHDTDLGGMSPHIEVPGMLTLNTPNLTRGHGGVLENYTPNQLARVVRFGIRPDGTAVAGMPVLDFTGISDADLSAVVSYLWTLDAVDRSNPKSVLQPMGRVLWYAGVFDLQFSALITDPQAPRPSSTPTDALEHGAYLFRLGGCIGCHGDTASGGPHPMAPPDMAISKNLTPHVTGLAGWTREDFDRAMRAGVSKDGTVLDTMMPWSKFAGLSPVEIDALWAHVQTLTPMEFGNR